MRLRSSLASFVAGSEILGLCKDCDHSVLVLVLWTMMWGRTLPGNSGLLMCNISSFLAKYTMIYNCLPLFNLFKVLDIIVAYKSSRQA